MSIIGVAAAKDYLYLAMTNGPKTQFSVSQHHRIPIDPNDWSSLLATLSTHLSSYDAADTVQSVVVASCAAGIYGASPEAFKAEGFAELRCQELGHMLSHVAKNGLKKHIGCPAGQKWQAYAKQLFNPTKQIKYFASGFDAAIAAAYGTTP